MTSDIVQYYLQMLINLFKISSDKTNINIIVISLALMSMTEIKVYWVLLWLALLKIVIKSGCTRTTNNQKQSSQIHD